MSSPPRRPHPCSSHAHVLRESAAARIGDGRHEGVEQSVKAAEVAVGEDDRMARRALEGGRLHGRLLQSGLQLGRREAQGIADAVGWMPG